MKKHGQLAVFMAIAALVLMLTMILFFDRLRSAQYIESRTQDNIKDYTNIYVKTTPYLFPQITVNYYSLGELFGYYVCYEQLTFNLSGYDYDLVVDVQRELDNFFGKNKWMLEINEKLCIDSSSGNTGLCPQQIRKNIYTYEFMYPLPCRTEHADGLLYLFL